MPTSTPLPTIRAGKADNSQTHVDYLRACLISQGVLTKPSGVFDAALKELVIYFQMTHQDSTGKLLTTDGEVGPKTWWALTNPSGAAQRSWLEGELPKGLSSARRKILSAALKDHKAGVKEVPDGSNYGGGVERYLHGVGPAFWCCYAVSEWVHDGTGSYPLGQRYGLVSAMWNEARRTGRAYLKNTKCPVPGDVFVLLYRNNAGKLSGAGHTGLVAAVGNDMSMFNTIEGNMGNRVKLAKRTNAESLIVGFIDVVGDSDVVRGQFSRGLLTASAVTSDLKSTR